MSRPFKVLGVQQIAIGGPDKGRLKTADISKKFQDCISITIVGEVF